MEAEKVVTEEKTLRWAIDFDWYKQRTRSFSTLAQNYQCPKCAKQRSREKAEMPVAKALSTIRDCCSRSPAFITHRLPIMDAVFRVFLLNGNKPLTIEELRKELVERLGGDSYRTSPEVLVQLLRNDTHYGIRPVKR